MVSARQRGSLSGPPDEKTNPLRGMPTAAGGEGGGPKASARESV